jgi:hypothetical protein
LVDGLRELTETSFGASLRKNTNWKTVAELTGIAAIVASLFFLGFQLKLSRETAVSEINASHYATFVELNNGIADHADVWSRGNAGLDLDQAETVTYRHLLDNFVEQYRIEWRHNRLFGNQGQQMSQGSEFAEFLYENPGARKIWTEDLDQYYASMRLI